MNAITSFIDASNVYGSDAERADRLRKLNSPRGLLDYDYSQRRIMLPFSLGVYIFEVWKVRTVLERIKTLFFYQESFFEIKTS